jgi:predicted transposase/invertase (TIGR01784 family)
VYALNLINENYLPQSPNYYHHYAVVHLQDSNERRHGLEFVFIELEKFRAQNIRDKKLQVLWLRFLTEVGEKTEQIDSVLLDQPEINKAIQYVLEASLTKEEKLRYEKNWDRISSEKTLLTAAKDEGMALGRLAEKAELARNAKKMGMSIDDISTITGLSREELDAL